MSADNKKPAAKITLYPVSAAIWARETEKGVFYSVSLERSYKDAEGKWKSSDFLNESDLLLGAKALDLAHTEILKLRANDRQAQSDEQAA